MSFTITLFISEVNQLSFMFSEQQAFHLKLHILLNQHLILYKGKMYKYFLPSYILISALTFLEYISVCIISVQIISVLLLTRFEICASETMALAFDLTLACSK